MSEGFLLRIGYRISGRLAFLSHLETIRSVERIVRRAGLPFAITEGFNPHMKIAFGPALPVGAGSCCEYVDLRLKEYVDPAVALAALQAVAPENLMPIGCEYVSTDADAIDVAFPVSVWKVVLAGKADALDSVREAFAALLDRGFIEVKKTKGRKETTKQVSFEGRLVDGPHVDSDDDGIVIRFTTYQGNEGALRPDKFVAAALESIDEPPAIKSLSRVELKGA